MYGKFDLERFDGVTAPLIVPLTEDRKIDDEIVGGSLESLVTHVNTGAHAILVNGATGEFNCLDYDTRKYNLGRVASFVDGTVPVIANLTADHRDGRVEKALAMLKYDINAFSGAGADAFLICPYYYDNVTNRNILHFMGLIATYSKMQEVPVFLYNNPALHSLETGGETIEGNISLDIIETLKNRGFIQGIKDSSGNINYFRQLLEMQDENFRVFQGSERIVYESFSGDVKPAGIVSGLANVAPSYVAAVYASLMDGSPEPTKEEFDGACHLVYGDEYQHVVPGIKHFLQRMGVIKTNRMVSGAGVELDDYSFQEFRRITGTIKL